MSTDENKQEVVYHSRGAGNSADIYVQINVRRITNINTIEQSFCGDIRYKLRWEASKIDETRWNKYLKKRSIEDNSITYEPEFIPQISFPNASNALWGYKQGLNEYFSLTYDEKFGLNMNVYNFTIYSTFHHGFDLKHFPFDCQHLVIRMKFGRVMTCQPFKVYPDLTKSVFGKYDASTKTFDEWSMYSPDLEFTSSNPQQNHNFAGFPLLNIRIKTQRNYKFYINRICIILFLITLAGFLGYAIEYDNTHDRISFDATLLLTIVAFQLVISSYLPRLSFLTYIDWYGLISLIFVLILTVVHVGATDDYDVFAMYGMIAVWILYNIIFIIVGYIVLEKEKNKLNMNGRDLSDYLQLNETGYFWPFDEAQLTGIDKGHYLSIDSKRN